MKFYFATAIASNDEQTMAAGYERLERLADALADAACVKIISVQRSSAGVPLSVNIHVALDIGTSDPECVKATFCVPGAHPLGVRSVHDNL